MIRRTWCRRDEDLAADFDFDTEVRLGLFTMRSVSRSSPVNWEYDGYEPVSGEIFGMPVPLRLGQDRASEEREAVAELALGDVSCLWKFGLKGSGGVDWLRERALPVPEEIYWWSRLPGGGFITRVDRSEFFFESGWKNGPFARIASALRDEEGLHLYPVERQDAGLLLSGRCAGEVLAQTCSFDFSGVDPLVVMTRVAGVSCMVLPGVCAGIPVFRVWTPPSYGTFLWRALVEIVEDLGGTIVGVEAMQAIPLPHRGTTSS